MTEETARSLSWYTLEILRRVTPPTLLFNKEITQILATQNELIFSKFLKKNSKKIAVDQWNIFNPFLPIKDLVNFLQTGVLEDPYFHLFRGDFEDLSEKFIPPQGTKYTRTEEKVDTNWSVNVSKYSPQMPIAGMPELESYKLSAMEGAEKEKKSKAKKKKKAKQVKQATDGWLCGFPLPTRRRLDGETTYIPCGTRLVNKESFCPEHSDQILIISPSWPYLCEFTICKNKVKDDPRSRKGFYCLKACEEDEDRCLEHQKVLDKTEMNNKVMRSFKVRLKLTDEQVKKYQVLTGCTRETKNWLVEEEGLNSNKSAFELAETYVNEYGLVAAGKEFLRACPRASRMAALSSYVDERENMKKVNSKVDEENKWRMKNYEKNYKLKKELQALGKNCKLPNKPTLKSKSEMEFLLKKGAQSLAITKLGVKLVPEGFLVFRRQKGFGEDPLIRVTNRTRKNRMFKKLLETGIQCDLKLCKTPSGKFYMHIPYWADKDVKPTPQVRKAVAVDPGVRKFMTTFDTDRNFTEYGKGMSDQIDGLRNRCKKLCEDKKTKKNANKIKRIFEEKIDNKITDMHYKSIKILTQAATDILIPRMNVTSMVQEGSCDLKTKKNLLDYRFGQMRNRLINKVELLGNGRTVHTCNESRTTMTCARCFLPDDNVGRSETYKCKRCSNNLDRDWNASANILLKYIATV